MSDLQFLWAIQLTPLIVLLTIQLLPKPARRMAPLLAVAGAAVAAISSWMLFAAHFEDHSLPKQYLYEWLRVSELPLWPFVDLTHYTLSVGFLVDRLNLLMITVVTTIAFFVQLFSYYYMTEDPSRPRYFGFLSFFAFSMTGLVLSSNLLQTFLFWELVGLTSYLLIGFWYEKQSAGTAARKAFVINRLADLGFYLGIILLFALTGSVNFTDLNTSALTRLLPASTLTVLGILVFTGVMGKSAQFPFHAWLPDAMEGPTPVSALIHSATMVAAGVFLLCRANGLFAASPTTLMVILVVGSLTAFVGASLGTIQRDIKRILAYSTMSQLGLMVMAIGAGSTVAGMFHLTTHAFFKSLLFLTSGAFIHRFHSNDIWEIGRKGGKKETVAVAALFVGLFSLCGIFPFAGFFSKDMILETLREHHPGFYAVALAVSFLTVYYSFRMLFVILFSKSATHAPDPHAHGHGHEDHGHHESMLQTLCRILPLICLAVLSLVAGFSGTPLLGNFLLEWLGGPGEAHVNIELLVTTTVLIASGAGLAFFFFRDPEKALNRLESSRGIVKTVLERKFFVDDAYAFFTKQIGLGLAKILNWFDRKFVDGFMVNWTSYRILDIGKISSKIQDGLLQNYLAWAVSIAALVILWIARFNPRGF